MRCSSTCLRRKIVKENDRTPGYSCHPPPQLRGSRVPVPGSPERSLGLKFPTPTGTHSKVRNKPHGNPLYTETAWSMKRKAPPKQRLSLEEALRGSEFWSKNHKPCARDGRAGAKAAQLGYNLPGSPEKVQIGTRD